MKVVQVYRDDTMDDIVIDNVKDISDVSNSQGHSHISHLYSWVYENYEFQCHGWYDGEAGFENKHDLPPAGKSSFLSEDSSTQLLFGDIFILKVDMTKSTHGNPYYVDCDISDYGEFYNLSFEGFHDVDDDGSNSDMSEDLEDIDDLEDIEYLEEKEEFEDTDDSSSDIEDTCITNDELGEDTYIY